MKRIAHSTFIILLISTVLVMGGCKKTSINGKVKSVTTTTTGQNPSTAYYTYDGQGRLVTYQNGSGSTQLTYSQSNVTVTDPNGNITIYTLNNQGYAGSDNYGNGTTYIYDNNGYLITSVTNGGAATNNTISNGDVVSSNTIGNGTSTDIYTFINTTDYRDFGLSFLGKGNKHLTNSDTYTTGGNTTVYTYSYVYDGQGRVQTQTITGNNQISTSTYTYTN